MAYSTSGNNITRHKSSMSANDQCQSPTALPQLNPIQVNDGTQAQSFIRNRTPQRVNEASILNPSRLPIPVQTGNKVIPIKDDIGPHQQRSTHDKALYQQQTNQTRVTDQQMRQFLKMYQMEHIIKDKYANIKQKPKVQNMKQPQINRSSKTSVKKQQQMLIKTSEQANPNRLIVADTGVCGRNNRSSLYTGD